MDQVKGLAVVTTVSVGSAIWHVSFGTNQLSGSPSPATLAGPFVVPDGFDDFDRYAVDRILLLDHEADLWLTRFATAMLRVQEQLDAAFDARTAGTLGGRGRPQWQPLIESKEDACKSYRTPEYLRPAVARAIWARQLLSGWTATETERLRRTFLAAHGGPDFRTLPPGSIEGGAVAA